MDELYRDIVGAIIESSDGKILLGRRSDRGAISNLTGLWHAPGGGTEDNESLEDALCREVHEETGIMVHKLNRVLLDSEGRGEITMRQPNGESSTYHMRFFMFHIALPEASDVVQLAPSEEFSEMRWFSRSELANLPLVPAGRDLFHRLGYLPVP